MKLSKLKKENSNLLLENNCILITEKRKETLKKNKLNIKIDYASYTNNYMLIFLI